MKKNPDRKKKYKYDSQKKKGFGNLNKMLLNIPAGDFCRSITLETLTINCFTWISLTGSQVHQRYVYNIERLRLKIPDYWLITIDEWN